MTQSPAFDDGGHRRLRLALLRGDDHHNLYLERLLSSCFDLVALVEEPGKAQRHAIWRRRRWKDAVAAEYHRLRRKVWGKERYRRHYFDPAHDDFEAGVTPPVLVVRDVNDERTGTTVGAAAPDVCVITCTTRLSADTIRSIGVPIVNIHGGHLPDYRGCHCYFTAIQDRRFDAIGSTIHFVDVGLDTGDVIEAVRPAVKSSDDPETLYSRGERLAAQRLVDLLTDYSQSKALPRTKQAFRGRLVLRRHRTPLDDIRSWWSQTTGRLRVPDVPGPLPRHPWEDRAPAPRASRSRRHH